MMRHTYIDDHTVGTGLLGGHLWRGDLLEVGGVRVEGKVVREGFQFYVR